MDHIKFQFYHFQITKIKIKCVAFRKMHEDEIVNIIDFAIKTGINKLAIVGENSEYSKTLIFTAKNILLKELI